MNVAGPTTAGVIRLRLAVCVPAIIGSRSCHDCRRSQYFRPCKEAFVGVCCRCTRTSATPFANSQVAKFPAQQLPAFLNRIDALLLTALYICRIGCALRIRHTSC